MVDSSFIFLEGVLTKLESEVALTGLLGLDKDGNPKIYTHVPQERDLPYLRIGISSEDFHTFDASNFTHRLIVQCFALSPSSALELRSQVYGALHRQELPVSSGRVVDIQQAGFMDLFQEGDGVTWQGLITFKAYFQA